MDHCELGKPAGIQNPNISRRRDCESPGNRLSVKQSEEAATRNLRKANRKRMCTSLKNKANGKPSLYEFQEQSNAEARVYEFEEQTAEVRRCGAQDIQRRSPERHQGMSLSLYKP